MSATRRRPLRRVASAILVLAATSLLVLACKPEPEPARPVPAGAPRLVLFIVADQLRADYLVRFRPLLRHGLARLLEESVTFTDAHQDHAATVTATGHATLSTGTFPSHHGIVGNGWYSREEEREVTSVYDLEHGASPRFLMRPALGDLMKEAWPDAKVYAIGGKARSAILTAGLRPDAAYWYEGDDGTFVTSTYYGDDAADSREESSRPRGTPDETEPGGSAAANWRESFHARKLLDPHFGETWDPLVPLEEMESYGVVPLNRGWFSETFPYALGGLSAEPDSTFYSSLGDTPFLDGYVTDFAKALIDGEGLGTDETPDFLGVTYAMLDSLGHQFGPDAPETLDTLLRLDRTIGDLLEFVDQRIGLENVVVTLSSDHGVGPVPEFLKALGRDAERFGVAQITCVQRAGLETARQFGLEGSGWMPDLLYLDREALSSRQVDADRLLQALAERLEACPRIERVFHPSELQATSPDDIVAKFARSYYAERSPDLLILLAENTLASRSLAASHGTPYRYDSHVPWLLRLPGVAAKQIDEPVRTVDVATTLAELLELRDLPDARFDGASRLALAGEAAPVATAARDVPSPSP